MAEAIGLASSVIAIADVAFKAGSVYLTITRFLDEMKQVPTELRVKAEKVRFLEEFLFYAEDNLSKTPLPSGAWNNTLLQDQISKCHTILSDVRKMVDHTMAQVTEPTSIRRKIALTRAIIRKDELKALDLKLDEALQLYQLAQDQYILAMMTYSLVSKAQESTKNVELHDTGNTNQTQKLWHISPSELDNSQKGAPTGGKLGEKKLEGKKGVNSANLSRKTHSVSYEPSIFGRFHFSTQANRGIHVVIQAPSWITSTVYSVLAQRATVGWQMNLRADEMVKRFDRKLLKLIEDDNSQAMFKYLDEHAMSPFVRNWKGQTLLYDAVQYGAVSATRALLDRGLHALETPLREREDIPRMLYHLGCFSSCDVDDKGPLLIKLLGDNGLDDYLDDPDFLSQAATCGFPFTSFRALIERCRFAYRSLPTWERLDHIRTVASCALPFWVRAWNMEEILLLLNEGKIPGLGLLQESRSNSGTSLIHTLAIGLVHCIADKRWDSNEDRSWRRVLDACFELDPLGVQHLDNIWIGPNCGYNWRVDSTPLSAMLCSCVCNGIHARARTQTPAVASVIALQSAFRLWIETLASSGENLLLYGKHERDLYTQGCTSMYQKFAWGFEGDRVGMVRYSILGITYGPLPQHWSLWITNENYDYGGEFWAMVENQHIKVPGSWVEDVPNQLDEYLRVCEEIKAWQQEVAPPFIWSEYRKPRPPI